MTPQPMEVCMKGMAFAGAWLVHAWQKRKTQTVATLVCPGMHASVRVKDGFYILKSILLHT